MRSRTFVWRASVSRGRTESSRVQPVTSTPRAAIATITESFTGTRVPRNRFDHGPSHRRPGPRSSRACEVFSRSRAARRSSPAQLPERGRASTDPVTEFRREEDVARAGESSRALTICPSGRVTPGAGGDIQTGLDDALSRQARCRRPPRHRSRQRSPIDDRTDVAAAGGCVPIVEATAADVGAVADDHARGRYGPRPSTCPSVPGVEVDEALVHDGRALGKVRAEPDAVGVGDAHALGRDVVRHPRELVDARHGEVQALGTSVQAHGLDLVDGATGPSGGPGDVGEQPRRRRPGSGPCGWTSRWLSRCRRRYASAVSRGGVDEVGDARSGPAPGARRAGHPSRCASGSPCSAAASALSSVTRDSPSPPSCGSG